MNRNLGASAGLLAILGLMFHLAPVGSEKNAEGTGRFIHGDKAGNEKQQDKSSSDEPYLEGPWIATQALSDVPPQQSFDGKRETNPKITEPGNMPESTIKELFSLPLNSQVDSIVATVADPLHSRLALFTDGSLDAIQAAAGAAGWVFAAQWVPWQDPTDSAEKDTFARRKHRFFARKQEEQPGLLVFRRTVKEQKFDTHLLLVFLVGETLTSGLSRSQFKNARRYMDALQGPNDKVLIQGPTFSGSFYSLHNLLNEDGGKVYFIRTGTATSDDDANALNTSPNKSIDFKATTMDARDYVVYLGKTLESMEIPRSAAALLIEDESAFGDAVSNSSHVETAAVKVFRFPREISQLRNAYRESKPSSSEKTLPPEVDFTLKDSDLAADSIPTFSRVQTPLAQDAMLENILSAVRRDRVRIVQIVATNVLDFLFLARVIQKDCPDTRILATDAHLLLVEAARTEGLSGILALTSYPMFPESNAWKDPRQSLIPFSSDSSVGVYNATSLVLRKLSNQQAAKTEEKGETLVDYGWDATKHPPVWLLTLDRDGFLPVRAWQHTPCEEPGDTWWDKAASGGIPPELPKAPSHTWSFVASATGIAGAALIMWSALLWLSDRRKPIWLWDGRFALESLNDIDRWRLFYLVCLFLSVGLALIVLFVPWWPNFASNPFCRFGSFEAALLGVVALFAAGQFLRGGLVFPSQLIAAFAPFALAAAATWSWIICCASPEAYAGLFFCLRANELRVGSSPSVPVLAALCTLAAFCIVHLTRVYLAACKEPGVNLDLESSFQCRLKEAHHHIASHLRAPLGLVKRREWAALAIGATLAFSLGFACNLDRQLSSVNTAPYNLLLILLQAGAFLAILHAAVETTALWADLKSFLLSLGALPLASAFIARSRSQTNRPVWVRSINVQSVSMLVRGATILHDLGLLRPETVNRAFGVQGPFDELQDLMEGHREDVKNLVQPPRESEGRLTIANRYKEIRLRSASLAARLFNEIVLPYWRTTALVGSIDHSNATETNENDPPGKVGIPGDPRSPGDLAQSYVAVHYSSFLLYAVQQLRNLAIFLSFGFVLLAISLTCYAPQSPQVISRFLLGTFVALAAVLWKSLAGVERDPILSRIEGTKAGELNAEFYFKLVGYGALPLVGLLASQFPAMANFLFSWIEPTLEALR